MPSGPDLCNSPCMDVLEQGRIPRWDLADRLRKSLREAGLGVQEIADYLGVSRYSVRNWINGHNRPSAPTIRLWAMRTGVSYGWLRKGEGWRPTAGELAGALPGEVGQLRKEHRNSWSLGVAA